MAGKLVKLASFWEKSNKDGDVFYSGKIGEANALLFFNKYKKEDKHPSLILYVAEPRKDGGGGGGDRRNDEDVPF